MVQLLQAQRKAPPYMLSRVAIGELIAVEAREGGPRTNQEAVASSLSPGKAEPPNTTIAVVKRVVRGLALAAAGASVYHGEFGPWQTSRFYN